MIRSHSNGRNEKTPKKCTRKWRGEKEIRGWGGERGKDSNEKADRMFPQHLTSRTETKKKYMEKESNEKKEQDEEEEEEDKT